MLEQLMECIEQVEFDGVMGRINFRHLRGPPPA